MKIVDNSTVLGEGFTVLVQDIHHVKYLDGKVEAVVEIEGGGSLATGIDWSIYSTTLDWLHPDYTEDFEHPPKQVVIERISKALTLLGMKNEIVN